MIDFGDMKNTVELVGIYGSDESHCLSAWTSTSRDLDDSRRSRMGKLLTMLAQDGHHSPFEKSSIHFLIKTELASHIHLIKHRVGVSVNSESARYKELKEDKAFIPPEWPEEERKRYLEFLEVAYSNYHRALKDLTVFYMGTRGVTKRTARKRAKECARFYLPYANQLVCDVQFNFRSFMHFAGLRYSTHAQEEICDVARKMLTIVKESGHFTESLKAFGFLDDELKLVPPLEGNLFSLGRKAK